MIVSLATVVTIDKRHDCKTVDASWCVVLEWFQVSAEVAG